jgi:RimJ/RimL family protein N-acetyltransferase
MTAAKGKHFSVIVPGTSANLALRAAEECDLPALREWKNLQSEFFFFKGHISAEQQTAWFAGFMQRPEDFMFMVDSGVDTIGCMGIRQLDDGWDIYNVILGSAAYSGKGLMSQAFQEMLTFASQRAERPISLKVLKHNPAVGWYQKNGFVIDSTADDHYFMLFKAKYEKEESP